MTPPILKAIESSRERETREWSIATEDAIVEDERRFREALAEREELVRSIGRLFLHKYATQADWLRVNIHGLIDASNTRIERILAGEGGGT